MALTEGVLRAVKDHMKFYYGGREYLDSYWIRYYRNKFLWRNVSAGKVANLPLHQTKQSFLMYSSKVFALLTAIVIEVKVLVRFM